MNLKLGASSYYRSKSAASLAAAAKKAIKAQQPQWEKTLTAIHLALIEDFGEEIADDLGAKVSMGPEEFKWEFDPTSEAIRAWIAKNGAESITSILATDLADVKRVILAGVEENLTTSQIAKNVRQFYADNNAYKAMRVARTEVNHAAGAGQREAARQSSIVKTHSWLSSRDDRVRDEHAALDGETVAFDEPYSDGSMYPGEKDINCRCVETFGTR